MCQLATIEVAIGDGFEGVDVLDGLIVVADVHLFVLVVEELAPAVAGAHQEVVVALVVLYQIGEDHFLAFHGRGRFLDLLAVLCHRLFFLGLGLDDMQELHAVVVVVQGAVVVGQLVIRLLAIDDVACQTFGHPRVAAFLNGHRLVGTIYLHGDNHLVGIVAWTQLVDVVAFADALLVVGGPFAVGVLLAVAVTQADLLFLEEGCECAPFYLCPTGTIRQLEQDVGCNLSGGIHLLFEGDVLDAHFIRFVSEGDFLFFVVLGQKDGVVIRNLYP